MNNPENYRRIIKGNHYYSQACQDLFVLIMNEFKNDGYYLEIGAGDPIESSNTFLLENEFNWKGCSIEYNQHLNERFNEIRRNKSIMADATKINYAEILESSGFPRNIQYLSLDIDPAENTYKALLKIPFDKYKFNVITYEHDKYTSGIEYMKKSREYLKSKGYHLLSENVHVFGRDFEDWYLHPELINQRDDLLKHFQTKGEEFSEIITRYYEKV